MHSAKAARELLANAEDLGSRVAKEFRKWGEQLTKALERKQAAAS